MDGSQIGKREELRRRAAGRKAFLLRARSRAPLQKIEPLE